MEQNKEITYFVCPKCFNKNLLSENEIKRTVFKTEIKKTCSFCNSESNLIFNGGSHA